MNTTTDAPSDAIASGIKNGCRFCLARDSKSYKIGDTIRILRGFRSGMIGTIVESPNNFPADLFLIQAEGDPPNEQQIVGRSRDLVEKLPYPKDPPWALPFSIEELELIDDIIIRYCDKSKHSKIWRHNQFWFNELIRHIWKRRLPISPEEVWKLLEVHGVPMRNQNSLTAQFENGINLLIHVNGRKPIRKKRLK